MPPERTTVRTALLPRSLTVKTGALKRNVPAPLFVPAMSRATPTRVRPSNSVKPPPTTILPS